MLRGQNSSAHEQPDDRCGAVVCNLTASLSQARENGKRQTSNVKTKITELIENHRAD